MYVCCLCSTTATATGAGTAGVSVALHTTFSTGATTAISSALFLQPLFTHFFRFDFVHTYLLI